MGFGGPIDLLITALLAARRFGFGRTLLASIMLSPVYLWSLPPVPCSCLGPMFRRCSNDRRYSVALRSDLKNLASQQEIYFSDFGVYSADLAALGLVPSRGVLLTIFASRDSWGARATHEALGEDRGCVLFVGEEAPAGLGLGRDVPADELVCQG